MGGVDVFNVAKKGVTLEVLVPSQNLNDSQMDGIKIEKYKEDVGGIFKIDNYITLPIKDIDTVASVLQVTNKAVMVWFFFENSEWAKNTPTIDNPNLDLYASGTARHSVTAVDFTLVNGKKTIVIEDSWGFWNGFSGQRTITEDFFKARNFFAAYPMSFSFDGTVVPKPQHNFLINMQLNQMSDEIKVLQDCLKYEGLFPSNIDSSGFFGAITKNAVQAFQLKYNIVTSADLGFGRVGPKTRAQLNLIYS